MKFRVLGPVEIYDDVHGRSLDLKGSKQRVLLATLLFKQNTSVSVERLMDELWGEGPPDKAVNALQAHVARLRKRCETADFDRDRIWAGPAGYALLVRQGETDADEFNALVGQARAVMATDPNSAVELFRKAEALWRGSVMEGSSGGELCAAECSYLEQSRLSALESLYEASLRARMEREIIGELECQVARHPLRERFANQLMVALYRCGRQADALAVYERVRRGLASELGVEPTPALTQQMRAILMHWSPGQPRDPVKSAVPNQRPGPRRAGAAPVRQTDLAVELTRLQHRIEDLAAEQQELRRLLEQSSGSTPLAP